MRFCFITPGHRAVQVLSGDTSGSGGAESQMAYIAADFAKLGIRVTLIYGDGASHSANRIIAGVECVDAHPNWRRPASLVRFLSALLRSQADFFYANLPDDFLFLIVLARLLRPRSRFVYALANDSHCNPWRTSLYRAWLHNPLYALGLFGADSVTLQHEGQRAAVRPYVRGKLELVPNLLRVTDTKPRPFDETTIDVLWVAMIRPQKRLSLLLDAAEQLGHFRFAVVGGFDPLTLDGATLKQLEERVRSLPNVEYYGPLQLDAILAILRRSKVLASTSLFEGFPNTMLEAWGTGVPVASLTVDPGGVISREGIGLVSGSLPQLMGDIERLAADQALNEALGRRGLAYVQRQHSLKALCDALEPITPGVTSCYAASPQTA